MRTIPFCFKNSVLNDAEEEDVGEDELRVRSLSQLSQSVPFAGSGPILSADSQGEILIVLLSFSGSKKKFHTAYKTNSFYCPSWQQGKVFFANKSALPFSILPAVRSTSQCVLLLN